MVHKINLDVVVGGVFVELLDKQRAIRILRVNPHPPRLLAHCKRGETAAKDYQDQ
ncbi:MAG TPA: hypothetical protein VK731_09605 [Candidatus Cybelea sp.]|nr:hypothetical protein [Candidatus Cybelea sp.]